MSNGRRRKKSGRIQISCSYLTTVAGDSNEYHLNAIGIGVTWLYKIIILIIDKVKIKPMKKVIIPLVAVFLAFTFVPNEVKATAALSKTERGKPAASNLTRLTGTDQIKTVDQSKLSNSDLKAVNKKVPASKTERSGPGGGGVIYISLGALIIIVLLLIIIL